MWASAGREKSILCGRTSPCTYVYTHTHTSCTHHVHTNHVYTHTMYIYTHHVQTMCAHTNHVHTHTKHMYTHKPCVYAHTNHVYTHKNHVYTHTHTDLFCLKAVAPQQSVLWGDFHLPGQLEDLRSNQSGAVSGSGKLGNPLPLTLVCLLGLASTWAGSSHPQTMLPVTG